MTPVYRWNGEFFGYLTLTGFLFNESGHYVAWISGGRHAWNALDGTYLGERVGAEYILRNTTAAMPPPEMLPLEPTSLGFLPPRPVDRTARDPKVGYVDGLEAL